VDCPPSLAGLDILVVEDDPDARRLIHHALSDCGATVRTANSAAEGLIRFDEKTPDVLISDISMPGEDGYSLIRKIRNRPPQAGSTVPAIALTAYASPDDQARALSAGFDAHIPKPMDPFDLSTAISTLHAKAG
jgi:CheY-like chemotaxis protein